MEEDEGNDLLCNEEALDDDVQEEDEYEDVIVVDGNSENKVEDEVPDDEAPADEEEEEPPRRKLRSRETSNSATKRETTNRQRKPAVNKSKQEPRPDETTSSRPLRKQPSRMKNAAAAEASLLKENDEPPRIDSQADVKGGRVTATKATNQSKGPKSKRSLSKERSRHEKDSSKTATKKPPRKSEFEHVFGISGWLERSSPSILLALKHGVTTYLPPTRAPKAEQQRVLQPVQKKAKPPVKAKQAARSTSRRSTMEDSAIGKDIELAANDAPDITNEASSTAGSKKRQKNGTTGESVNSRQQASQGDEHSDASSPGRKTRTTRNGSGEAAGRKATKRKAGDADEQSRAARSVRQKRSSTGGPRDAVEGGSGFEEDEESTGAKGSVEQNASPGRKTRSASTKDDTKMVSRRGTKLRRAAVVATQQIKQKPKPLYNLQEPEEPKKMRTGSIVAAPKRVHVTVPTSGRVKDSEDGYTIYELTENDILSGRGNGVVAFPGNKQFREIIQLRRREYVAAERAEKTAIANEVVDYVRTKLDPPGRFLQKDPAGDGWREMSTERVYEKTCQALREKLPLMKEQPEVITKTPRSRRSMVDIASGSAGRARRASARGTRRSASFGSRRSSSGVPANDKEDQSASPDSARGEEDADEKVATPEVAACSQDEISAGQSESTAPPHQPSSSRTVKETATNESETKDLPHQTSSNESDKEKSTESESKTPSHQASGSTSAKETPAGQSKATPHPTSCTSANRPQLVYAAGAAADVHQISASLLGD